MRSDVYGVPVKMDVVYNLIHVKRFFKYTEKERIEIKKKGRPMPDLTIETIGVSRGKSYTRRFNRDIYSRNDWVCGCNKKNALFCFPCLLFGGDKAWTWAGITDLVHLSEKMRRHENSKSHLYNTMEFAIFGAIDLKSQLDSAYWRNRQQHNDDVSRTRYVLSKMINCIKFCGAFELALPANVETATPQNPGLFRGLINFSAELDAALAGHLQNAPLFEGTSKEIQNDLLDCMLEVCQEEIVKQINEASCLAIIADEITDVKSNSQQVVIFRYTRDGEPIERFWGYFQPENFDAKTLTANILSVLDPLIEDSLHKLIAQSYSGAAVMSGQHAGVQAVIKQKYPSAHFVHYYGHQLKFIISKATSSNSQVRVFFANLKEIPQFFNNAPECLEVFNKIVEGKSPHSDRNYNERPINVVYECRECLIECMEEIEDQFTNETVCNTASAIRRMLEDSVFVFWLTFFHYVMPHVDKLFHQLQKRRIDPAEIETAIHNFQQNILQVQNVIHHIINEASKVCTEPQEKKRKRPHSSSLDRRVAALEVCEIVINCAKDRFVFTDHLIAASLFHSELFGSYHGQFPEDKVTATCLAYPILDKERLTKELNLIYSRNDCRELNGTLPLLKFIVKNNLEEILKETKKLLEIVVTTPSLTSEGERCFSTLQRIKNFLRNAVSDGRLTALSMLSIEKKFILEIDSFNEKVIEKFAAKKDRRIELIYKK